MLNRAEISRDVMAILSFLDALGFERLPLRLPEKPQPRPATGQGRNVESEPHGILNPDLKQAALDALRSEIGDCTRCKLSAGRTHVVFGEGNPDADLMFIGEAPGRDEDLQARPFVGDAGKLLTRLIEKMGFRREDVYIANIVKCRPPQNRDPEEDEVGTCLPFLERQIRIIAPRVIFSLGRISAHTLTGSKVPITRLRGRFSIYRGIPLMPTFHPAYLLRNPNAKWDVWNDAKAVLEKLREERP